MNDCAICGGPEADHGVINGYHDKHAFEPQVRQQEARAPRCNAAKFMRHVGDLPSNRVAIYATCDRIEHDDDGHHFVDGYGRAV